MPRVVLSKFPHRHSFYEILYVKEGKGTHVIDFEPYQIQPPSLYFISPGQVHFWQQDKPIDGRIILFTGDFLFLTPPNKSVLSELEFFHSLERHPHLLIQEDQMAMIPQLFENLIMYRTMLQHWYAGLSVSYRKTALAGDPLKPILAVSGSPQGISGIP